MRPVGYSTGALALGDFLRGLRLIQASPASACELSALRENELRPLIDALDELDLSRFRYVSFHAPSHLVSFGEAELVDLLTRVAAHRLMIVCHPDIIQHTAIWLRLGSSLVIENMDKRKPVGRTWHELEHFFEALPEAGFCLDLGHARQIDPTMTEARALLAAFLPRLRQLHLSEVNSDNVHEPLTMGAIAAIQTLAENVPRDVPVIIESPVGETDLRAEMSRAISALDDGSRNGSARNGTCPLPPMA